VTGRRVIVLAIVGALTTALTWAMGVVLVDAVLIGLLLVLLVGTPMWLGYPGSRDFSSEGPDDGGQRGYYEVRRIGSMFRRESGSDPFARLVAPRLRQIAERRLAASGLRWDDTRARERLGTDVFDWLDGRPSPLDARPHVVQTELVLDRLDTFDSTSSTMRGRHE